MQHLLTDEEFNGYADAIADKAKYDSLMDGTPQRILEYFSRMKVEKALREAHGKPPMEVITQCQREGECLGYCDPCPFYGILGDGCPLGRDAHFSK